MARRLGVRTPVSRNAANTLGGLKQGVTPLDMAHAYETFAQGGKLTYGTLSPGEPENRRVTPIPGPVGIEAIGRGDKATTSSRSSVGGRKLQNRVRTRRVLDAAHRRTGRARSSQTRRQVRHRRPRAAVPGVTIAGKTGTTEGYGDAWFVGWTKEYTVAVWVGYPDQFKPMETEFQGDPVAGGTYPAGIFKTFIESLVGHQAGQEGHAGRRRRRPSSAPGASAAGRVRGAAEHRDDAGDAIEGGGGAGRTGDAGDARASRRRRRPSSGGAAGSPTPSRRRRRRRRPRRPAGAARPSTGAARGADG